MCGAHLHAVGEHDAHGHELGEDPEQLGVGQHAVLQAAVQEARVVAQHVIDVRGLPESGLCQTLTVQARLRFQPCLPVPFLWLSDPAFF